MGIMLGFNLKNSRVNFSGLYVEVQRPKASGRRNQYWKPEEYEKYKLYVFQPVGIYQDLMGLNSGERLKKGKMRQVESSNISYSMEGLPVVESSTFYYWDRTSICKGVPRYTSFQWEKLKFIELMAWEFDDLRNAFIKGFGRFNDPEVSAFFKSDNRDGQPLKTKIFQWFADHRFRRSLWKNLLDDFALRRHKDLKLQNPDGLADRLFRQFVDALHNQNMRFLPEESNLDFTYKCGQPFRYAAFEIINPEYQS